MVHITEELVRRRAEHNEGEMFSLEELSLHQQDLHQIQHLQLWCRNLRILYLQNNLISTIENLGRLKKLEYLNLALNNIEIIENLEGCESLQKLDLTVNFIGRLSSVLSLTQNFHLRALFLTGNPCSDFSGYREYVLCALPQLQFLDGAEISRSERLRAAQGQQHLLALVQEQEEVYVERRNREKKEQRGSQHTQEEQRGAQHTQEEQEEQRGAQHTQEEQRGAQHMQEEQEEQRGAQHMQEEQRGAQHMQEEQRGAQHMQEEQRGAQHTQEEQRGAQHMQEEQRGAQHTQEEQEEQRGAQHTQEEQRGAQHMQEEQEEQRGAQHTQEEQEEQRGAQHMQEEQEEQRGAQHMQEEQRGAQHMQEEQRGAQHTQEEQRGAQHMQEEQEEQRGAQHTRGGAERPQSRSAEEQEELDFWQTPCSFSPESRLEAHRRLQETRQTKENSTDKKHPPPRTLTANDGRVLNVNEAKLCFSLTEDEDRRVLLLDLGVYRHLASSLIQVDVQPLYVRVLVKAKMFQMVLPAEVKPDASIAQRSQSTGHLLLSLPLADGEVRVKKKTPVHRPQGPQGPQGPHRPPSEASCRTLAPVDFTNIVQRPHSREGPLDSRGSVQSETSVSALFVDDPDVPPLM